jgi:adenylate cyclase
MQVVDRRYEEAIESAKRAVVLGPGEAEAYISLGYVYMFDGAFTEAAAAIEAALRLDPDLAPVDRRVAGLVYFFGGDSQKAVSTLERARDDAPGVGNTMISLAAAYAVAGRIDEARAAITDALKTRPNDDSLSAIRIGWAHFRSERDLERLIDALRSAGLQEWPFGFKGDPTKQLNGDEITELVIGRTLRGVIEPDQFPAIMQIGEDGQAAYRSLVQFNTETVFVKRDLMCEQSENLFGRADCGPVYRRDGEPAYTYVNSRVIFHFSPAD